jgi:DNA-directed RNA polymerase specialized sigma24 family protein
VRRGAPGSDHPGPASLTSRSGCSTTSVAPSPALKRIIVVEELDRLLNGLPEDLRKIALWKLEGFTNAEIACMIGRTVRCVELKMQLIRKRLELRWEQEQSSSGDEECD